MQQGVGPTLAERSGPPLSGAAPAAPVDADPGRPAPRRRPVITRHCWVSGLPDCPGRFAGLVVEWSPGPAAAGWLGRVVYVADGDNAGRAVLVEGVGGRRAPDASRRLTGRGEPVLAGWPLVAGRQRGHARPHRSPPGPRTRPDRTIGTVALVPGLGVPAVAADPKTLDEVRVLATVRPAGWCWRPPGPSRGLRLPERCLAGCCPARPRRQRPAGSGCAGRSE